MDARTVLRQTMIGYQDICVIGAAAELGVFGAIMRAEGGRANAPQIADLLGCDLRGTNMLLDALCSIGFLDKTNDNYGVTETFVELLDPLNPGTMVPILRHTMNCIRGWSQLSWAIKAGFPAPETSSVLGFEEDFLSFILGMNSIAITVADPLVEKMKALGLLNFRHFLDVGGASGTYTRAFLRAVPEAKATIFDHPIAILEAQKRCDAQEFASRISMVSGDFYVDELPGGADFAWVSAIIHQMDRNMSRTLYSKVYSALIPGGRIAIRDIFLEKDGTAPRAAAMFAVNMLARTKNGRAYKVAEVFEDLEASGFLAVNHAVPADDMNAVIIAEKPA